VILNKAIKHILLLLFVQTGFAQKSKSPFIFDNFVDKNGTASNNINCFLQDKNGFLWVGTSNGLKRFDGDKFTIFKYEKDKSNSLVHNVVMALCEDKLGRIWVGTEEGVCYFDKQNNQFFNVKETNEIDYVCLNILCDEQGDIWFSIRDRGLYRYSEKTKKLQNFQFDAHNKSSIGSNRILRKSMVIDPLKRGVWMATTVGMTFFEFSTNKFYSKKNNPKKISILDLEDVSSFALDGNTLVFYNATARKIVYFDCAKNVIIKEITAKTNYGKYASDIGFIYADNQHNLWISTWDNTVFFYDSQTLQTYQFEHDPAKPNSIAANTFWCAFEQANGNIWLGTINGISITNPKNIFCEIYDLAELYAPLKNGNQLYQFLEDSRDSTWWLAATPYSFVHFSSKQNLLETFNIPHQQNDPHFLIKSLIDYKNQIYAVTTKSIYIFDKKNKKPDYLILPAIFGRDNSISFATQKGDSIWVFTNNTNVFSLKLTTKKWSHYIIQANVEKGISGLEVDNNNDVWIAIHATGLAKFSKEKQAFELVKATNKVNFNKIGYWGMKKDRDGNFWIATYDLVKFNTKKRTFISALKVNNLTSVAIDKDGQIWTARFNDFTVFNPKTQKSSMGTIQMETGDLKWNNSLFTLRNGQIISLMRGFILKMDPTKINSTSTKDKMLISRIQLINSEILLHNNASSVSLETFENGFSIYFSVLNSPDEPRYRNFYQLMGYNEDWVSTRENSANFSNLEGGDYEFKVKGIASNGVETHVSTLNIHIDTIFYKSKWFLALIACTILGLIYAFYRYRTIQIARFHELQLQTNLLEKDKSVIQYQNLINHLNPHFLFNSLSSLSSLIESEDKDVANKFLDNLSKIYRYILKSRESETVSLLNELKFTENYIKLQKTRFVVGFQVVINIKDEYNYSKIVPVTLQNLIENAIKHNIIDEESPLIITIYIEDDYLIVSNNFQPKKFVETSNQQGLESMKSLYKYLTNKELLIKKTEEIFSVYIPLI
jgi:ligand-binding sensor domain-containing protein